MKIKSIVNGYDLYPRERSIDFTHASCLHFGGMHNDYRYSQMLFFWENVDTLFRHLERLVIQVQFEETRRAD